MTEIMIDGVDVSGCCLYKDGICLTDKGKCTSMCDYGAYAREEELKRLEQENAKLKEILEKIKEVFKKYDSEEEGTVAELLHDVFEVYGKVCEVLKDE